MPTGYLREMDGPDVHRQYAQGFGWVGLESFVAGTVSEVKGEASSSCSAAEKWLTTTTTRSVCSSLLLRPEAWLKNF